MYHYPTLSMSDGIHMDLQLKHHHNLIKLSREISELGHGVGYQSWLGSGSTS